MLRPAGNHFPDRAEDVPPADQARQFRAVDDRKPPVRRVAEDRRDRPPGAMLDEFVGIEKRTMAGRGEQTADRGFADAAGPVEDAEAWAARYSVEPGTRFENPPRDVVAWTLGEGPRPSGAVA